MATPTDPSPELRPGRWWRRLAVPVALVLLAGACGGDDDDSAQPPTTEAAATGDDTGSDAPAGESEEDDRAWPGDDWSETTAEAAGLDPEALDAMAARAEAGGSECLVVTHDGELVAEWYWQDFEPDTVRETFSASKSVTSALVGIAQDQGLLDIEQPASDFIEEWQGTPSEAVTIRNLVSNDSGRFQDFDTDYAQMAGQAEDKTAFSIALEQQHEPGTEWVYNNAAIQTLEAVLEEASGTSVGEFAEEHLFGPIGMDDSSIATDPAGNALMFMGVQSSCRDMARFGLLFERGGEWDGEQVVSSEWVEESTQPSQDLNAEYGFLWWLNDEFADGPVGPSYAALGLNGQVVAVVPDADLVVTRLGANSGPNGEPGFGYGDILAGTSEALGGPPTAGAGDEAETGEEAVDLDAAEG